MKTGDIVRVHDVSHSKYWNAADKVPCYRDGNSMLDILQGLRWRVVAANCSLPTDRSTRPDAPTNEMLLSEVDHPEHLLFTKGRFCTVLHSCNPPPKNMTVDIPEGTEHVTIHRSLGVRFTFEDCKTKD